MVNSLETLFYLPTDVLFVIFFLTIYQSNFSKELHKSESN